MGQAKRRTEAYERAKVAFLEATSGDARVVGETAIKLFDRFVFPNKFSGGCYQITATLHRYLSIELGIPTRPVVGYVNDGTDDVMISHAWLEYQGLVSDLTLVVTNPAIGQPPGDLLILGKSLKPGQLHYSYHTKLNDAALTVLEGMKRDPETAQIIETKEAEHKMMTRCFQNSDDLTAYLDAAPEAHSYAKMTSVLR